MARARPRPRHLPLWLLAAAALVLAGCDGDDQAADDVATDEIEEVTIDAVIAWDETNELQFRGFDVFRDEVEALSDGRVQIQLIGGPETIDPFDLGEAVRGGDVSLSYLSAAYYMPELPEVAAMVYSELTVEEEREQGALEFMDDVHRERLDATLLGRGSWEYGFAMYSTTPVESIEDFAGLRLRASPSYVPFIQALGAESVTMAPGEIYTALERGVIDGYGWPEVGVLDLGLEEQTGYKIYPAYWRTAEVFLMNVGAWEALEPEVQDILIEAVRAAERDTEFYDEMIAAENEELEAAGVEFVTLEGDEAEEYLELASESAWDWVRENVQDDPEALIELFSADGAGG